jgi:hypothetical protein
MVRQALHSKFGTSVEAQECIIVIWRLFAERDYPSGIGVRELLLISIGSTGEEKGTYSCPSNSSPGS